MLEALSEGERLRTPVGFVVHSLADVNDQLARGRYFFIDIVRDGIVLFEEPGHPFIIHSALKTEDAAQFEGMSDLW